MKGLPGMKGLQGACAVAVGVLSTGIAAQAQDVPTLTESLAAAAQARVASEERAAAIERDARAAADRLAALQHELVIAAYAVQDAETVVAALDQRIAATEAQVTELEPNLAQTQAQLFQAVLALHAVAQESPLARLAADQNPNDILRAGIVMSSLTPQLQDQVRVMAGRLQALRDLKQTLAGQLAEVAAARDELADERSRLTALHDEVDAAYASQSAAFTAERARSEALAAEVDSLSELISALRRAAAEAPRVTIEIAALDPAAPEPEMPAAAGGTGAPYDGFVPPVRGDVTTAFGETRAGVTASGMTLVAAAAAQVVSPFAGHVAYAGAFPGRGLVLIIDHGQGYHSVLTGLARIDTAVGRQLLAGEPVGVLGGHTGTQNEAEDGVPQGQGAFVTYELRRDGVPIDPMPWFLTVSDGING